jgi:hypothetical protein
MADDDAAITVEAVSEGGEEQHPSSHPHHQHSRRATGRLVWMLRMRLLFMVVPKDVEHSHLFPSSKPLLWLAAV